MIYAVMIVEPMTDTYYKFFDSQEKAVKELERISLQYDRVVWDNINGHHKLFHGFTDSFGNTKKRTWYVKEVEVN